MFTGTCKLLNAHCFLPLFTLNVDNTLQLAALLGHPLVLW